MKTLKISGQAHVELTLVVGRLMAETGETKTYSDVIESILDKSVILSPELLDEVEGFTKENAQLGCTTKEEFIKDAVCFKLTCPRQYDTLQILEG